MPRELEQRDNPEDPAYHGPYDAEKNGKDAFDHPVNGDGRCELLNRNPPECPPDEEAPIEPQG